MGEKSNHPHPPPCICDRRGGRRSVVRMGREGGWFGLVGAAGSCEGASQRKRAVAVSVGGVCHVQKSRVTGERPIVPLWYKREYKKIEKSTIEETNTERGSVTNRTTQPKSIPSIAGSHAITDSRTQRKLNTTQHSSTMVGLIHESHARDADASVDGVSPLKIKGLSLDEASATTMETAPANMSVSTAASPYHYSNKSQFRSPSSQSDMGRWLNSFDEEDSTAAIAPEPTHRVPWERSLRSSHTTHRLSTPPGPRLTKKPRYRMQRAYNPASAFAPTLSSRSKQFDATPVHQEAIPCSSPRKRPHPGWAYSDYQQPTESWVHKTHGPPEDPPACPFLVSPHTVHTPNGRYSLYGGDKIWKPFPPKARR